MSRAGIIGVRYGPPKMHRLCRIGLPEVHRQFRIGPPKMHTRFCIGRPQVSLNLLPPKFQKRGILLTIAIMKEKQKTTYLK